MRFARRLVPLIGFLAACAPAQAATRLRIHPTDETGRPLELSRAELYLDAWGHGRNIPLIRDEHGTTLELDRTWRCKVWPEACADEFIAGRVILEVRDRAPIVSRRFVWLGGMDMKGPQRIASTSVRLEFPAGEAAELQEGDSKEIALRFRAPRRRVLRVVDTRGGVLPGTAVRAALFWADSNHCGAIEGEVLLEATTDGAGEVLLPDADAEYAFEFEKAHHVLAAKPQRRTYARRLVSELRTTVTTVALRELDRRALRVRVTSARKRAASGLTLVACVANCPCGACCGQKGTTDRSGRILVEDFYPEEWDEVRLTDQEGKVVWEGRVRDFPRTGWASVILKEK